MISHTDTYGATHQVASTKFVGNEGQQAAILLKKRILVEFGKLDASRFLTTPLADVMREIDDLTKEGGTITINDRMRIRDAKEKTQTKWTKAYWNFKDFFTLDGIAQSLIGHCDDTMDLPAAWHLFNLHMIGGPSLQGVLMSMTQFYDPSMIAAQALEEFSRRMRLFHQLEDVKEDASILGNLVPQNPALPTPAKNQTPAINRALFRESSATSALEEGSTEGISSQSSSQSSQSTIEIPSPTVRTTTITEWVKVMLTLFMMKTDSTHSTFIEEFIQKFIVEKITERNSVFGITEAIIYDQMRSFSSLRDVKAPAIKLKATHIENCGMKDCIKMRRFHPKEECWYHHPELRPAKKEKVNAKASKNDSTSSTKQKRGNSDSNRDRSRDQAKNTSRISHPHTRNNTNSNKYVSSIFRSRAHDNIRTHFMQVFNLDEKEINEIEAQGTAAISGNEPAAEAEQEEEEEYEELGPPKKFQVNMMRIQRISNDEPEIKVMISDIIAENLHKRTASADSATQTSVMSLDNINRCFNLKLCTGTIVTATGATKSAIKFRGLTFFFESAIDVYLADINRSVVAATVTCRKNNMQWVFGPGPRGESP